MYSFLYPRCKYIRNEEILYFRLFFDWISCQVQLNILTLGLSYTLNPKVRPPNPEPERHRTENSPLQRSTCVCHPAFDIFSWLTSLEARQQPSPQKLQ